MFSWGTGTDGALGHGDKMHRAVPTPIAALPPHGKGGKAVGIACGRDFSMVLLEDGSVVSFGADDFGQLGQGRKQRYVHAPVRVGGFGDSPITSIAAGEFHAAAISASGQIFTWGLGKEGQLGHGVCENASNPRMMEELGDRPIVQVGTGPLNESVEWMLTGGLAGTG